MKQIKIILALLLLGCLTLPSFAQTREEEEDYIPFVEQGKTWWYTIAAQILYHYGDEEFDGKSEGCFALTLHGEYDFHGHKWMGIFLIYKGETSPFPIGLLREEDREVYLLNEDKILAEKEMHEMEEYYATIPCCLKRVLAYNPEKNPDGLKVLSFKKKFQYLELPYDSSYLLEDVFTTHAEGDNGEVYERRGYTYLFLPEYVYSDSTKPYDFTLEEYNSLIDRDEEYFKESKLFSIDQDKDPYDLTGYLNGYSFFIGGAPKMLLLEGIGFTHISFYSTPLFWATPQGMLTPYSWLQFVTDSTGNIIWGRKNGKESYEKLMSGIRPIANDNINIIIDENELHVTTSGLKGNLRILDVAGTRVCEYPVSGDSEEWISLPELSKGVYIATLEAGGCTITRKFVK